MAAPDVAEHLVGQAQVPDDPCLGLWSRVAGFARGELPGPLDRSADRTAVMRATIHLVSAARLPDAVTAHAAGARRRGIARRLGA
jgi:hypothetical protein